MFRIVDMRIWGMIFVNWSSKLLPAKDYIKIRDWKHIGMPTCFKMHTLKIYTILVNSTSQRKKRMLTYRLCFLLFNHLYQSISYRFQRVTSKSNSWICNKSPIVIYSKWLSNMPIPEVKCWRLYCKAYLISHKSNS